MYRQHVNDTSTAAVSQANQHSVLFPVHGSVTLSAVTLFKNLSLLLMCLLVCGLDLFKVFSAHAVTGLL